MQQQILMVDDEPRLLDAMRRSLYGRYSLTTASSPAEGLDLLAQSTAAGEPFAVVVSDMMMPLMNGAQFLTKAGQISPDSIRMILSGQSDLNSTVDAVNGGNLFRFLLKPCEPPVLMTALDAALRQHQLVRAERDLLSGTLNGAVAMFSEALALVNPEAFRRAARLNAIVQSSARALGLQDDWELALAGNLGQIGCVSLPGEVIEKVVAGVDLGEAELLMYRGHPAVGRRLLERVPRLDRVARWVGDQPVTVDDKPAPEPGSDASRVFATAAWMLTAVDAGLAPTLALRRLITFEDYPEPLLDALLDASAEILPHGQKKEIAAVDLRLGMVFTQDVLTSAGLVLVREGQSVTEALRARLQNFANSVGLIEPLHVIVGQDPEAG